MTVVQGSHRHRLAAAAGRSPSLPAPSRWAAVATGFGLLLAIGTYGLVGPSPVLAGALAVGVLIGALLPRRMTLGRVAQVVFSAMLLVVGVAVVTTAFIVPEPVTMGTLRLGWSAAAFAVLLAATGRLFVAAPSGGHPATLAAALFGLAFCGGTVSGLLYPLAVCAFLVAAALARRLADPGRAPLDKRAARSLAVVAIAVTAAVGVPYASTIWLPHAHGWMVRRIMQSASGRTGFSTRMSLGSLQSMLLSERVVLRLRGQRADYLRGMVFTRYDHGRWSSPSQDRFVAMTLPRSLAESPGLRATQVEVVEDDPDYYFLPLQAHRVAVATGVAGVHATGVARPLAADPASLYWFDQGGPRAIPVAQYHPSDLHVPVKLQRPLALVAERFTSGVGADPQLQLTAIEKALMTEYRYSLSFERRRRHDPLVEFLEHDKQGHCEYFASAMVMLARSRNIPARLVAGYRVTEYSELGEYYLVRERNAHSWVEAWVPDKGWTTFDPTPAADLALAMRTATPWPSAAVDLVRSWWAAALRWLDQRTILELAAALLALVAAGIAVRLARLLRERASSAEWLGEPPLELFVRLSDELARHGLVRAEHEPIERLAERVQDSGLAPDLRDEAAEVLSGYAALRYGGLGDVARLESDAAGLVRRLRRGPERARESPGSG